MQDIAFKEKLFNTIWGITKMVDPKKFDLKSRDTNEEGTNEDGFQLELSKLLSKEKTVLREVGVFLNEEPKEVDLSLFFKDVNEGVHYIVGELKFHGEHMEQRTFVEDVKSDYNKMNNLLKSYAEVPFAFCTFLTCVKEEMELVRDWAEKQHLAEGSVCVKESTISKKYHCVSIGIIPNIADYHARYCKKPRYTDAYNRRLNTIGQDNDKMKRYYFVKI